MIFGNIGGIWRLSDSGESPSLLRSFHHRPLQWEIWWSSLTDHQKWRMVALMNSFRRIRSPLRPRYAVGGCKAKIRASSSAEGTRSSISICLSLYFSFSFLPTRLFHHRRPGNRTVHASALGNFIRFSNTTLLFFRRQLPNRIQKKKLSVK